jgi:hypothetical protein
VAEHTKDVDVKTGRSTYVKAQNQEYYGGIHGNVTRMEVTAREFGFLSSWTFGHARAYGICSAKLSSLFTRKREDDATL